MLVGGWATEWVVVDQSKVFFNQDTFMHKPSHKRPGSKQLWSRQRSSLVINLRMLILWKLPCPSAPWELIEAISYLCFGCAWQCLGHHRWKNAYIRQMNWNVLVWFLWCMDVIHMHILCANLSQKHELSLKYVLQKTIIPQCIKLQAGIYAVNREQDFGPILTPFLPFKPW